MIDFRALRDPRQLLRWLPLLLIPVLLLASTYPGEFRVPVAYWILAMSAGVVFGAGARWPLSTSIVLSALAIPMFRIPAWGVSGLVPYLGAVALVDAVARTHRASTVWLASGGWAAAVVLGRAGMHDTSIGRASTAVEAAAYVCLPLLLGLYLRGQRDLSDNRAADVEARARLDERAALARELHDVVAHHMASIVLRMSVAGHVLRQADPRITEVLDDVRSTATASLADIRRLLTVLRDPGLGTIALVDTEAIAAEIEAALQRVRVAGFQVDARIDAEFAGLDAIERLTLLRLVQESLTNVMKHADRDAPVLFRVAAAQNGIEVHLLNRGHGSNRRSGHGIVGMRERIELTGGTLDIGPDGPNWVVRAWLPGSAKGEHQP
ncbi:sensor histidine kinase [Nocardia sp. NBC_01329]|uniref:sensor histidine kinase n=1 Tax=Nocardia sp. NBC_01329 TaxID=2903594 RepID=UPI002E0E7A5A|nr:histidine kinase [Nocardia sp. NBC_01329]